MNLIHKRIWGRWQSKFKHRNKGWATHPTAAACVIFFKICRRYIIHLIYVAVFTDCVTLNTAATKFLFCSPFGLFTWCTVAGCFRALWLHTAHWWSAWRGVTGYSSFSILRCCPNTWGTPFQTPAVRSHPRPRRACRMCSDASCSSGSVRWNLLMVKV